MATDFFAQIVDQYDKLKYALLEAQTFNPDHFGFPPLYYRIMETDQRRVGAFTRAFDRFDFTDKVVCEAGVGRLVLSQHYLSKVRRAYLIENNPALFDFIKNWVQEQNLESKVVLLFGDARTVQLPETVDFIIGEMMSIFCANEFQVQVFQHLRKFLKPGGQLFPQRILNLAQLALVDDGPHKHYPINFTRHWPEVLSNFVQVDEIDLFNIHRTKHNFSVEISPLLSGMVNAVLLRSSVEIVSEINFTGTDSLMPPTVLRLPQAITVVAGKRYRLQGNYSYGTSLDEANFSLLELKA